MNTRQNIRAYILLIGMGLLAFFATIKTPMLYDDDHAVVNNAFTQNLDPYPKAFYPENLLNRPVLQFTFAVNRQLGELNVFGYHLVNVGIHIGVALVFYCLLLELLCLIPDATRAHWSRVPFWAAAIHLLHPLAVEPVAYISSRSSLLATLFYLLGLLCLTRFYKRTTDTGIGGLELLLGFVLFFYLGCGTKAIVVTLPIMGVLFIALRWPKAFFEKRGTEAVMILFPTLVYLFWRTTQLGSAFDLPGDPVSSSISRVQYGLTQIEAFVFYYLTRFLFPINQNFEPDFPLASGIGDTSVGLALLILIGIGLFVWKQTPRLIWFGAAWCVITLLPTSSIIPLKQIVTEHRFYLPGLGASLVLAGLFNLAVNRFPRLVSGVPLVMALLFLLTQNRSQDFQSALTIWEDTALKSPNKALVHNNLATVYLGEKRFKDAETSLQTTLKLAPSHIQARINLGVLYAQTGRQEKALEEFSHLIQRGSRDPVAYYNAGLTLKNLKRYEEAVPLLEMAAKLNIDKAEYHFTLGQVYQLLKRNDEALLSYRRCIKLDPKNAKAHLNRGTIFWDQGHFYFADGAFQQAYQIAPESTLVLSNLVSSNMVFHNYEQAIVHLETWLKLEPDNSSAQQYLIAARRLKEAPPK